MESTFRKADWCLWMALRRAVLAFRSTQRRCPFVLLVYSRMGELEILRGVMNMGVGMTAVVLGYRLGYAKDRDLRAYILPVSGLLLAVRARDREV